MLPDEIAAFLQARGFGTVGGANGTIFIGNAPDSPDNIVYIHEETGRPGVETMGHTPPVLGRPRFTVTVRNLDYETGRSLANQIYLALSAVVGDSVGGYSYTRIRALGEPSEHPRGRDLDNRWRFVTRYEAWRTPG